MEKTAIYTHNIAADIVELFENLLEANGVVLPSPEDGEKEEGNAACIYGSVYSDLLDAVEGILIETLDRHKDDVEVVTDEFE